MRHFTALYARLDRTNSTLEKTAALRDYFAAAPAADAAWAVFFLCGQRPRQAISAPKLRALAADAAGIPIWLFEESYDAVGDLAETIAHLLPPPSRITDMPLHEWIEQRLLPLPALPEEERLVRLRTAWDELDWTGRLVWNKLTTGSFRVGVSAQLVIRALSRVSGVDADVIAHRLAGEWTPSVSFYEALVSRDTAGVESSRPYPFFLSHPLEEDPRSLGEVRDWQAEWKWDGIRCQIVRREGRVFLWSRGDEVVSDTFPEIVSAASTLPDGTVLDGEVLAWKDDRVAPFNLLQKRLGRKTPGRKVLQDAPVVFLAFDLLERSGRDVRATSLRERRAWLEALASEFPSGTPLRVSEVVSANDWDTLGRTREQSRERLVEGLMLKRLDSGYGVGRTRGDWWKWKIGPYTVDAVLIYAQRGHGRRASLYTDYTFGVWDGGALVPFAKAYSGLTDAEIREVDDFIRRNTVEKFGPVRTVKPAIVCELAFEGIQRSPRHKAGIAVRFPRIARLRRDKPIQEADTLERVRALLPRGA
ncbi:MAG: ATP-dependent DNA ligase [Burkholderiales bacterium]